MHLLSLIILTNSEKSSTFYHRFYFLSLFLHFIFKSSGDIFVHF